MAKRMVGYRLSGGELAPRAYAIYEDVSESMSESAEACGQTAAFQNTDDADPALVLAAVRHCASSWVGDARLLGNVRARDIVRALDDLIRTKQGGQPDHADDAAVAQWQYRVKTSWGWTKWDNIDLPIDVFRRIRNETISTGAVEIRPLFTHPAKTVNRCPHCDDTGDVHRADGEWLGRCDCKEAMSTQIDDLTAINQKLTSDLTALALDWQERAEKLSIALAAEKAINKDLKIELDEALLTFADQKVISNYSREQATKALATLKLARPYVARIASRTSGPDVRDHLSKIDALIGKQD